jgi:ATP-dependent Lon protease
MYQGVEVKTSVVMTGEITLTGFISPVAGIVPKLTAASEEPTLRNVILPADNHAGWSLTLVAYRV